MTEHTKCNLDPIIIKNLDVGIRIMDENHVIRYWNDNASRTLVVNGDLYLDKRIKQEDLKSDLFMDLLQCLNSGRKIINRTKIRTNPRGEIDYYLVSVIPIMISTEILGVIEIIKSKDSLGSVYNYLKSPTTSVEGCSNRMNSTAEKQQIDFFTVEENLIHLLEKVHRIAAMDYNVLIYGETGTGKEIVTRIIHNSSPRKNKPLVAQNCAAIPESLLESTFFGTEIGGFTGAVDKKGLFEIADGGTLLLDELNSLPVYLQAKLLRVLEDQSFRRVGGKTEIRVNTRVICTTNIRPELLMKNEKLREDLFYRLGPMYISIPPLRQRKSDIDYLTRIFLKKECKKLNLSEPVFTLEAKKLLREYPWPGNVRELKNTINGILMNSPNLNNIGLSDLPEFIKNAAYDVEGEDMINSAKIYQERIEEFEKKIIKRALFVTNGNISEASKLLGIKRQTLQYKIKKVIK